ncbi:MAG: tetratricopeptide repeat protein [Deltaproteobacteria bacterium]|nr:tetratricopeptide repeat protein [Deltaproteobacteria bacterium]
MRKTIIHPKKVFHTLLPLLILFPLPWITYFNTLNNDFVFDDLPLIQANETLSSLNNATDIINLIIQKGGYRTVITLSYAIDYHFSGLSPLSYNISNIIYHTINSLLVYLLTLFLLKNRIVALFTALLFTLHPVHTDSVTYMAGRRDILFTIFYLIGFYAFLKYRSTHRFTFILFSIAAYLLSIGSKEMGVTLPAIFLLYDLVNNLPQKAREPRLNLLHALRTTLSKIWIQYKYFYTFFFTGALAFTYYKVFINSPSHQKEYYGDSLLLTLLTSSKIIVHYIKLLIFPLNLVADYSYNAFPLVSSPLDWASISSIVLLLAILLVLVRMFTIEKWIAFGGIWFFITLLPVCQIFPHHELLAEHYLYLPSYGFCLITALLFNKLLEETGRPPLIIAILIAIILLFSLRIIDRNRDWKDGMALWSKTVRTVPRCVRAQNNLGVEYLSVKKYKESHTHLEAALAIKPNYAEAHNNLGLVYKEQGLYDHAISSFTEAIRYNIFFFDALNNLATTFERKGEYGKAIKTFNYILKKKPKDAQAYNNLGIVYQQKGQLELANKFFSTALFYDPHNVEAHNNLGVWYKNRGLYDKAIEEFKLVLSQQPDLAEVHSNLGAVYNNKGWYDHAISESEKALRLKPHLTDAMNNLGKSYIGKEWYDQALRTFKKALVINPDLAIPHFNLAIIYLFQIEDSKKALYHIERALEIEPRFSQAEVIRKKIKALQKEEPLDRKP